MRLTCPRCGAQYEIDAAAIPATGRDVECSACSHVWHATATDSAAHFDPAERPALSRPLNESILSVLREEAARELQARTTDTRATPQRANADQAPQTSDPDWPATTVTHPAPRMSADILAQRMERDFAEVKGDSNTTTGPTPVDKAADTAPALAAQTDRDEADARKDTSVAADGGTANDMPTVPDDARPAPVLPAGAVPALTVTAPEPIVAPSAAPATSRRAVRHLPVPSQPARSATRARSTRRRAYNAGFNLAFMGALVLLAMYALAPRLADQGQLGARLVEWRMHADQGRDWLQARADRLVDNLRP